MSTVSRTQLKTYFITGASPSEAQFGDFIDSSVNVTDDVTDSHQIDDSYKVFSAAGAKIMRELVNGLDDRVILLENVSPTNAPHNYYNKEEVDAKDASIGQTINNLPFAVQIAALTTRVTTNETDIAGNAGASHGHQISSITDLQTELSQRVTLAFHAIHEADLLSAINSKVSVGHTHVMADITDLANFDLTLYAKLTDLDAKANTSHTHLIQEITDIATVYYNKTEIDSKIAVVAGAHTHIETDITDLDKYTQVQTNLKIQDHSTLANNPHVVTKTQISLGNVENLSSIDLFASGASSGFRTGIMSDVQVSLGLARVSLFNHASDLNNPHVVTKTQVSLGNVPNVDVKALFDSHLASANPHNINLTFFDVYSKAETVDQVTLGLDSIRYAFKPTSPTDGAGSIGDLTWAPDASGFYKAYLKVDDAKWRAINLFPENVAGDVIFNHETTFNEDATFKEDVTVEGISTLGNVSIAGSQISTALNNLKLLASTGIVEVDDDLQVNSTLDVVGCAQLSNVSICGSTLSTTDNSSIILSESVSIYGGCNITGDLTVNGTRTIINTVTLDIEDNIVVLNKNVTGSPATNSGVEVERGDEVNSSIYWDETVDLWRVNSGGTANTIAFDEELDAHVARTDNPHSVTKYQVSLGNCDNTSDMDKPISTATQLALDLKSTVVSLAAVRAELLLDINNLRVSLGALADDVYSSSGGA